MFYSKNSLNTLTPKFLMWFKAATEKLWKTSVMNPNIYGGQFQPGTKWLPGLSEEEIKEIEREWGYPFPPDYKLFLMHMNGTDRPKINLNPQVKGGETKIGFPSWPRDLECNKKKLEDLYESWSEFLVEDRMAWPKGWGNRPSDDTELIKKITLFIKKAPLLIPVYEHRYLVASPCKEGNPVLSIIPGDVIVYGYNLKEYLLLEFQFIKYEDLLHKAVEIPVWYET